MRATWLVEAMIVGGGGFVGSALRYGTSGLMQRLAPGAGFPYGTLAVNVVGCLLIGVLGGLVETRQILGVPMRLFLLLGLLGGYTTYSTFGYETLALARDGQQMRALANVLLHVTLGLAAVWTGLAAARTLVRAG